MRKILAALFFLLLFTSTAAALTVLEYEPGYPADNAIVKGNSTYEHVVKIRIGSNSSAGPLIINVMFNASDPWVYERYEATLNSSAVAFNVSESDVVLENRTVHRISFYNDSLSLSPPDSPAELVLKVYLLSPNITEEFVIDTGGIYVPDSTALPLKHTNVSVDATPPVIVNITSANIKVEQNTGAGVNISWRITDDNPGYYWVRRNGTLIVSPRTYESGVPVNVSVNTTALGYWNYTIYANDSVGNFANNQVNVTVVDTTLPVILNLTPPENSIINATPVICVNYSDSGSGINISSVRIIVDGVNRTANTTVTPDSLCYTPLTLRDGLHNVTVILRDNAGNSNSKTWNFTVDTQPPSVTIDSPKEGESFISAKITVSCRVTDNINVASVAVNGTKVTITPGASVSFRKSVTLKAGKNTITVIAKDAAGNTGYGKVNVTYNRPTRRGIGGGGGGYIVLPPPLKAPSEYHESMLEYLHANKEKIIFPTSKIKGKTGVIEIGARVSEDIMVRVTISKVSSLPADVTSPGKAYTYFEILFTKYGTQKEVESSGYIKYRISKEWLKNNNAKPSDVQFLKWNNSWVKLPSNLTGEDDEYYYFDINVSSFSLFAVALKTPVTPTATPTPTTTVTQTPKPTPTLTPSPTEKPSITPAPTAKPTISWIATSIIGIVVAVIAAAVVIGYMKRRR